MPSNLAHQTNSQQHKLLPQVQPPIPGQLDSQAYQSQQPQQHPYQNSRSISAINHDSEASTVVQPCSRSVNQRSDHKHLVKHKPHDMNTHNQFEPVLIDQNQTVRNVTLLIDGSNEQSLTSNIEPEYSPSAVNNQHAKYVQSDQIRDMQQVQQLPMSVVKDLDVMVIDEAPIHQSDNIDARDQYTEEVIQAILAAKEALEKQIEERDDKDILLIDNLCHLVHGFDVFPKTVRRALAAQAVLIVIDEKDKELIVHNEELDSYCVLIFGECEQLNVTKTVPIKTYRVGDAFGVCEPTTDTVRFVGHMITKCENCAFLCVKRDDFYSILTDPANYSSKEKVRHRDRDGNIVCVSSFHVNKKMTGPFWSSYMLSVGKSKIVLPDGHRITKVSIRLKSEMHSEHDDFHPCTQDVAAA